LYEVREKRTTPVSGGRQRALFVQQDVDVAKEPLMKRRITRTVVALATLVGVWIAAGAPLTLLK
jgi:hypothetical protein